MVGAQVTAAVAPDIQDHVLNLGYRLLPESGASRSETAAEPPEVVTFVPGESRRAAERDSELSLPARVMVRLLHGVHW